MFNSLVMMSIKMDRNMIPEPKFVMEDSITWDLNDSLELKLNEPIQHLQLQAPWLPEIGSMSDDNYRDICSQIIEEYIKRSRRAKEDSEDYVSIKNHRKLPLHLRCLLWKLKEGWSYERIAVEQWKLDKESGEAEQYTKQAVGNALVGKLGELGLAELLGVNL